MRRSVRFSLLAVGLGALVGVARGAQPNKRLPDLERGEELYLRHCVQCHGVTGAGDGPATAALVAKVPDLRGALDTRDLDPVARLVLDGKGAMPGFETSFDRYDARRALRYLDKIGRGGAEAAGDPVLPTDEGEPDPDAAE